MLNNFSIKNSSIEQNVDIIQSDMNKKLPFKNNMFDMIYSVSSIQWILKTHLSKSYLKELFLELIRILKDDAKAVFQ